jgi:hypothetical protein
MSHWTPAQALEKLRVERSAFSTLFRHGSLDVPAGAHHRFYDFSEDFGTWVFFYGPQGGDSA